MAESITPAARSLPNANAGATPGTARFDSILVFVFTIAVALASFPHRSGYPLADAVEYLKNASRVESGLPMIQNSVRPFFFSAFLVPIFRAVRVFGSSDGREVIVIASAVMLTIAGLAAVATYRFVAKLAGAPAALGAALFLAANRIFQFWTPTISTDVPCAACLIGAASLILGKPSWKSSIAAGALLGAAILFKYQAMLVVGLILLSLPFLWWGSGKGTILKYICFILLGVLAGLFVQCFLDWAGGRGFGTTLWNYVKSNVIYPWAARFGPVIEKIFGYENFKNWVSREMGLEYRNDLRLQAKSIDEGLVTNQPYTYYWNELPKFLTWTEFTLGCLGALVLIIRRPRAWWFPLFVLTGSIAILNVKASKEWRLFVSITPFVYIVVGVGFSAAVAWVDRVAPRVAPFVAMLCIAPNLVSILGGVPLQTRLSRIPQIRPLLAYDARTPVGVVNRKTQFKGWRPWQVIPECTNPADFGGYERAANWLNQNAAAGSRISATWFWQFHFRLRPDLFVVEPLYQIDDKYKDLPELKKTAVRDYLKSLDYFVSHLQALVISPELFDIIEREFELVTIFESPIYDETLHSIFVLKRRARPSDEGWWLRVYEGPEAQKVINNTKPDQKLVFYEGEGDARKPVIELLDCDFDPEQLSAGRMTARMTWRVPEGTVANGRDLHLQLRIRNGNLSVMDEIGFKVSFDRVADQRFRPGTVFTQRLPLRPPRDLYDFARANKTNEAIALSLYLQLVRDGKGGIPTFPLPDMERFSRLRDPDSNAVRIGGLTFSP